MGTKKTRVTYRGMNQDISKGKYSDNLYYDAQNMKLAPVEGQTFGAISNAYGNKLALTIPSPTIDTVAQTISWGDDFLEYTNLELNDMGVSGTQEIIGSANTRDGFLLFTTDDNGFDCIWEVENSEVMPLPFKLLYARDMGFRKEYPIQAVFNYENDFLQKVFWVDGSNYLRYVNISQSIDNGHSSNLIDLPVNSVNSRSNFNVTQPEVISAGGGGTHTAGVIQYGYTLYNLNGSETSISPLSNLYPLDKGTNLGGGEVNEVVGAMPVVQITNLDKKYSFLKLYSIKYTSYNSTPSISLVYDGGIGNHNRFTFNDTGSKNLGSVGIAEFLFLGADAVKPKHIASKENILFIANNTTTAYELDIDTRAYSYNQEGTEAKVYGDIIYTGEGEIPYTGTELNAATDDIPEEFDAVNLDFDTYRYMQGAQAPASTVYLQDATFGESFTQNSEDFTDLPVMPVNGETTVTNGRITLGEDTNVRLTINTNMVITDKPLNAFTYALAVKKNADLVNTFQLVAGTIGTVSNTFTLEVPVLSTDTLELVVVDTELDPVDPLDTWALDISGTVTVDQIASGGSNGEGGTGKFLAYELARTSESEVNTKVDKFFKDNEIYRLGILFRNSLGQESEAKWIADFKAPEGNLQKQYNTLKIHFLPEFYARIALLPEEEKPVSYSVLRALRTENDKTIITQGMITGMMAQIKTRDVSNYNTFESRAGINDTLLKVPQAFTRGYGMGGSTLNSYYPLYPNLHNKEMGVKNTQIRDRFDHPTNSGSYRTPQDHNNYVTDEIHADDESGFRTQATWQYNKLMQMHSPEAVFQMPINTTNTDELVVLGHMRRNVFEYKFQETRQDTQVVEATTEDNFTDGEVGHYYYPYVPSDGEGVRYGPPGSFGLIGPTYRNWNNSATEYNNVSRRSIQWHTHKTFYDLVVNKQSYEIYGTPEVTEIGQAPKFYNNDASLKYANRMITIITDTRETTKDGDLQNYSNEPGTVAVDSEGNRCITFALGGPTLEAEDRPALETLFANTSAGPLDWDSELFAEIRRSKEFVYSGAIYGGYDRFSRANTEYVNISTHDIDETGVLISSPGDTFVQLFKNTRLTRLPGSVYSKTRPIVCETLDYLVETTVNLEERNDLSIGPWGKVVDPFAEEANSYNQVYSTDPVLRTYTTDNLKLNTLDQLETQVMASKVKLPGEFVESWVDFRPNEVQNLDGKYGPINALVSQWDEIFTFQDFGVARLGINPRVQVQGNDGVAIELGEGSTLHDYTYLSTNIGSVNKWGITPSNSGIYFTDTTTKQLFRVQGNEIGAVSEQKGMHTFFYKNLDKNVLQTDNPIIGEGISTGVDMINGDIYTTIKDSENGDYTVAFNEKLNAFTGFYSFTPSSYVVKGDKMFTTSPDNNQLWLHYDGDYQRYYGTKHESSITLLINTDDVHAEKVFNNIEFDSEVTLDDVDVDSSTIDSIEAWNDYQRTGKIPLIVGENIRRRMRTWRTTIPRENSSRMRMRDKWIFLKLGFNPGSNYKLVLHDMIVSHAQQG